MSGCISRDFWLWCPATHGWKRSWFFREDMLERHPEVSSRRKVLCFGMALVSKSHGFLMFFDGSKGSHGSYNALSHRSLLQLKGVTQMERAARSTGSEGRVGHKLGAAILDGGDPKKKKILWNGTLGSLALCYPLHCMLASLFLHTMESTR